ncbi:MAG: Mur ligase family protein [Actinomycetota bacterium]|nr:Mur ligase family protein [Actinomycetota bacterium]
MAGTTPAGWAYSDALAYLDGLVNLEAVVAGVVAQPTLRRIHRLMALMGDAQRAYPVVHLTGTNGKGSTARMITVLLAAMGLSVGTYTSPDLERVNERLAWNEEPIDDDDLAGLIEAVAALEPLLDEAPSRFEVLTAAAYRWFADVAVDVAVVEVGLGGRWDATNVADATVSVVTNVSADHAEILGPTLVDIAAEKAGIVKPGALLVLGETDPGLAGVFRDAGPAQVWERDVEFAVEANRLAHGGRLVDVRTPGASYKELYLPVHGAHQADNAAVALAAAEAFFGRPLPLDLVEAAFARLRLPGRMEVVSRQPLVLLDGAHNPAGARAAAATLAEEFEAASPRILVLGMLRPRDPAEMLEALGVAGTRLVVAVAPPSPRAVPAADVAAAATALGVRAEMSASVAEAVALAHAEAADTEMVLVTGSLYLVGAAGAALRAVETNQ